jgi:hypothetical protein
MIETAQPADSSCIRFGETRMRRNVLILAALVLVAPLAILAQDNFPSAPAGAGALADLVAAEPLAEGAGGQAASPMGGSVHGMGVEAPFSRLAVGAGISPLGIELEAATNLNGHLGLRGTGDIFNYSTNFTTDGIGATAKLSLASARISADIYPFRAGFRISPGILLANQNGVTGNTNVPAGTSFTLNNQTYYSANPNAVTGATPIVGSGALGLHANNPAFAITAGWGNVARGRGHWSVPVEAGVAFIGAPTVKVNLTGWACYDQAQTLCTNISNPNDPIAVAVQSNLTAQVAKWSSDLNPLKTYPIVSVGLDYSFHIR